MPVLKNTRHEAFAQALARGTVTDDAYVEAGFKFNRGNAARLKANESVQSRVDEIKAKAAKRAEITVQSLADELEEARGIALAEKQSSAAVSATMGKAKLFGLGVENRKLSGTVQIVTITPQQLDGLTNDELDRLEAAYPVLRKLGLVGGDGSSAEEAGD